MRTWSLWVGMKEPRGKPGTEPAMDLIQGSRKAFPYNLDHPLPDLQRGEKPLIPAGKTLPGCQLWLP